MATKSFTTTRFANALSTASISSHATTSHNLSNPNTNAATNPMKGLSWAAETW